MRIFVIQDPAAPLPLKEHQDRLDGTLNLFFITTNNRALNEQSYRLEVICVVLSQWDTI